jgi:hypothetical protein
MIDRGERLLILHQFEYNRDCTDPANADNATLLALCETPAWFHERQAFLKETRFENYELDDFTCDRFSTEDDRPLTLVNHFLAIRETDCTCRRRLAARSFRSSQRS